MRAPSRARTVLAMHAISIIIIIIINYIIVIFIIFTYIPHE